MGAPGTGGVREVSRDRGVWISSAGHWGDTGSSGAVEGCADFCSQMSLWTYPPSRRGDEWESQPFSIFGGGHLAGIRLPEGRQEAGPADVRPVLTDCPGASRQLTFCSGLSSPCRPSGMLA